MIKYADWHCDTASSIYETGEHISDSNTHINLKLLKNFDSPVQIFAVWLRKEYYNDAFNKTVEIINNFKNEIKSNLDSISLVKSYKDIVNNKGRVSAMLSIEGCEALEGSIEKLDMLYDMGVRLATLTWNYKNCVATGVMESNLGGGLTEFGRKAVRHMEDKGIIIDVSHISDEGFYSVAEFTEKPFIASHSNCRSICKAPRNLADEQIRLIGERKGIIGLNMCQSFLNDSGKASVDDVIKHTEHMLGICGENSICLGCDFDGIPSTPEGMDNVTYIKALYDRFETEFGKDTAYKVVYGNFIDFIKDKI